MADDRGDGDGGADQPGDSPPPGQHPVDRLIRELVQSGRPAAQDELDLILERISVAALDTRLGRAPGYLRGQVYRGRTVQARDETSFVHLVKRVRHDRQWTEGTTEADYLADLRAAARQPDARLLIYARHDEHHAAVIAPTALVVPRDRRGARVLPNLLVVYSAERSAIRTGYQFSDLAEVRIPEDARWLT